MPQKTPMIPAIESNPRLEVVSDPFEMTFDADGMLANRIDLH